MKPSPKANSSKGVKPASVTGWPLPGAGVAVGGRGGTVGVTVLSSAAVVVGEAPGVRVPAAGARGVAVAEKAGRVLVGVGSVGVGDGDGVAVLVGVEVGAGGAGVGSMMGVTGTPVGVGGMVAVGSGVMVGNGVHVGSGVSVGSGVLVGSDVRVAVGSGVRVRVGVAIEVGVGLSSP